MPDFNFFYGTHVHDVGEVYPREISLQPLFSDRGRRWGSRARMNVAGSFVCPTSEQLGPAGIATKIAALNAAYAEDYKDAGFLFDGAPTAHYMLNNSADSLTGNQIKYRSWLHQSPAELFNTRSFAITIGADYVQSYSEIISFRETVDFTGNGGPDWDFRERWEGLPERIDIAQMTPIRAVQSGTIVTLTERVLPPAPLWPDNLQGKYNRIRRTTPHDHGHPAGGRYTHYSLTYSYRFAFQQPMGSFTPYSYADV